MLHLSRFKLKRQLMPEDDYYEAANISTTGLTLQQLLEYYRALCDQ
ncbi:MAG: hypothetical protein JWR18_7 [Segetibacter sp.]|jgi:hypothetical protein|nr:hypothetical protein [Segetibacter sp.]